MGFRIEWLYTQRSHPLATRLLQAGEEAPDCNTVDDGMVSVLLTDANGNGAAITGAEDDVVDALRRALAEVQCPQNARHHRGPHTGRCTFCGKVMP